MAERFYLNCDLAPGPVALCGPEAHHLAVVCRARPGDRVVLFNGDGREYPARVEEAGKREVTLTVLGAEAPAREVGFRLEVAAPLPRGDRGAFLVEKLTEVGATRFVPLQTQRSVLAPGEARLEKLQRQVVEASKQCGRNTLMAIDPLTPWAGYCRRADLPPRRLLAHPGAAAPDVGQPGDIAIAVGPEGGFTDAEVALGLEAGWRLVSLGPRILRVETAAVALAFRAAGGA